MISTITYYELVVYYAMRCVLYFVKTLNVALCVIKCKQIYRTIIALNIRFITNY